MKHKNSQSFSRRKFIQATGIVTGASIISPSLFASPSILKYYSEGNSKVKGVQIGAITYSFRSMPDQSAEATLQYIVDSGISAIELMGDPAESYAGIIENPIDRRAFFGLMRKSREDTGLTEDEQKLMTDMGAQMEAYSKAVAEWRASVSMDKFTKLRKMYKSAGVSIYGFKPNAFGENNTDAEIDYGFRAAKALGASHITLEHPSDDLHTMKLGKMAAKHKIYVGYHGHLQQTPTLWDTALAQSKYNALNLDLGHYVAAGNPDPTILIKKHHNRIMSMHVKDRQNLENGQKNMPFGSGNTPIVEVLQLMRDNKYKFPATVELEYNIPEGSDAIKELAKCVEYCKTALEA